MSFRKSLLISVVFHLMLLFLIPGIGLQDDRLDWVEVSLLTFPDLKERHPDMVPGDPETALPSLPPPSPEKTPAPLDLPEVNTDLSTEIVDAAPPDTQIERRNIFPIHQPEKSLPGRPDRRGILDEPGDDPGEVITGPGARRNI